MTDSEIEIYRKNLRTNTDHGLFNNVIYKYNDSKLAFRLIEN